MKAIDDIIKLLPDELKEVGKLYLPVLGKLLADEIEAFAELVGLGYWQKAYRILVSRMSTDELLQALEMSNKRLEEENIKNATFIKVQGKAINDLLKIAFYALLA